MEYSNSVDIFSEKLKFYCNLHKLDYDEIKEKILEGFNLYLQKKEYKLPKNFLIADCPFLNSDYITKSFTINEKYTEWNDYKFYMDRFLLSTDIQELFKEDKLMIEFFEKKVYGFSIYLKKYLGSISPLTIKEDISFRSEFLNFLRKKRTGIDNNLFLFESLGTYIDKLSNDIENTELFDEIKNNGLFKEYYNEFYNLKEKEIIEKCANLVDGKQKIQKIYKLDIVEHTKEFKDHLLSIGSITQEEYDSLNGLIPYFNFSKKERNYYGLWKELEYDYEMFLIYQNEIKEVSNFQSRTVDTEKMIYTSKYWEPEHEFEYFDDTLILSDMLNFLTDNISYKHELSEQIDNYIMRIENALNNNNRSDPVFLEVESFFNILLGNPNIEDSLKYSKLYVLLNTSNISKILKDKLYDYFIDNEYNSDMLYLIRRENNDLKNYISYVSTKSTDKSIKQINGLVDEIKDININLSNSLTLDSLHSSWELLNKDHLDHNGNLDKDFSEQYMYYSIVSKQLNNEISAANSIIENLYVSNSEDELFLELFPDTENIYYQDLIDKLNSKKNQYQYYLDRNLSSTEVNQKLININKKLEDKNKSNKDISSELKKIESILPLIKIDIIKIINSMKKPLHIKNKDTNEIIDIDDKETSIKDINEIIDIDDKETSIKDINEFVNIDTKEKSIKDTNKIVDIDDKETSLIDEKINSLYDELINEIIRTPEKFLDVEKLLIKYSIIYEKDIYIKNTNNKIILKTPEEFVSELISKLSYNVDVKKFLSLNKNKSLNDIAIKDLEIEKENLDIKSCQDKITEIDKRIKLISDRYYNSFNPDNVASSIKNLKTVEAENSLNLMIKNSSDILLSKYEKEELLNIKSFSQKFEKLRKKLSERESNLVDIDQNIKSAKTKLDKEGIDLNEKYPELMSIEKLPLSPEQVSEKNKEFADKINRLYIEDVNNSSIYNYAIKLSTNKSHFFGFQSPFTILKNIFKSVSCIAALTNMSYLYLKARYKIEKEKQKLINMNEKFYSISNTENYIDSISVDESNPSLKYIVESNKKKINKLDEISDIMSTKINEINNLYRKYGTILDLDEGSYLDTISKFNSDIKDLTDNFKSDSLYSKDKIDEFLIKIEKSSETLKETNEELNDLYSVKVQLEEFLDSYSSEMSQEDFDSRLTILENELKTKYTGTITYIEKFRQDKKNKSEKLDKKESLADLKNALKNNLKKMDREIKLTKKSLETTNKTIIHNYDEQLSELDNIKTFITDMGVRIKSVQSALVSNPIIDDNKDADINTIMSALEEQNSYILNKINYFYSTHKPLLKSSNSHDISKFLNDMNILLLDIKNYKDIIEKVGIYHKISTNTIKIGTDIEENTNSNTFGEIS